MAAEVSSVENMPRGQYPVTMKDSHKWPSVYDFSLWLLLDNIGSNGIFLEYWSTSGVRAAFFTPPLMPYAQPQKGAVHFACLTISSWVSNY